MQTIVYRMNVGMYWQNSLSAAKKNKQLSVHGEVTAKISHKKMQIRKTIFIFPDEKNEMRISTTYYKYDNLNWTRLKQYNA